MCCSASYRCVWFLDFLWFVTRLLSSSVGLLFLLVSLVGYVLRLWLFWTYSVLQSTLVISTSLTSNNSLSRSGNLVPVLTGKPNNR